MAPPKSNLLAGWSVVVADDEQFVRAIVVRMVRDLGCAEALTATSGHEAIGHLHALSGRKVALVADFSMPGIDGLTAAKMIRSGQGGCKHDIPIIMLTGHADSGLVSAALALDVDSFIVKPVSTDQLAVRFQRALDGGNSVGEPAQYRHVDVDEVRKRMIRRDPVSSPRPPSPKKIGPKVIHLPLPEVRPGQVLAEEIRTPSGDCLLGAGVVLNERYLRRLTELAEVIRLQHVPVIAS